MKEITSRWPILKIHGHLVGTSSSIEPARVLRAVNRRVHVEIDCGVREVGAQGKLQKL